jgi:hypothetical protein
VQRHGGSFGPDRSDDLGIGMAATTGKWRRQANGIDDFAGSGLPLSHDG